MQMNQSWCAATRCGSLALSLLMGMAGGSALAAPVTTASDNADNYAGTWTGNAGTGWGSNWVFRTANNAGFFSNNDGRDDFIDSPTYSWGFYANGGGFDEAVAYRAFGANYTNALSDAGDQFRVSMDMVGVTSDAAGFVLRNGNSDAAVGNYTTSYRLEVFFQNGFGFRINDSGGARTLNGILFGTDGHKFVVTLGPASSYQLDIFNANGDALLMSTNGVLAGSGAIQSVALYNRNTENDVFFNNMELRQATETNLVAYEDFDTGGTQADVSITNTAHGYGFAGPWRDGGGAGGDTRRTADNVDMTNFPRGVTFNAPLRGKIRHNGGYTDRSVSRPLASTISGANSTNLYLSFLWNDSAGGTPDREMRVFLGSSTQRVHFGLTYSDLAGVWVGASGTEPHQAANIGRADSPYAYNGVSGNGASQYMCVANIQLNSAGLDLLRLKVYHGTSTVDRTANEVTWDADLLTEIGTTFDRLGVYAEGANNPEIDEIRLASSWKDATSATGAVVAVNNGIWTNKSATLVGSWTNASGWNGLTIGYGAGKTGDLSKVDLTNSVTLNLDGGKTLAALLLGDASGTSNWTLNAGSGSSGFVFDNNGGPALLIKTNGGLDTINVGIAMNSPLSIRVDSAAIADQNQVLTIGTTANISGTNSLTYMGPTAALAGAATNRYSITVNGAKTYSGSTTIRTNLRVAANSTAGLGLGTNAVAIESGGQLYQTVGGTWPYAFTLSGPGWREAAGELGAIRMSGGTLTNRIVLVGDARIGAAGSSGTINSPISGNGRLEIGSGYAAGTESFTMNSTLLSMSGGILVKSNARYGVTSPSTIGAGTVTVESTGQAYLTGGGNHTNVFVISGIGWSGSERIGAIRMQNNGISGTIVLNGDASIAAVSATGMISGTITGETSTLEINELYGPLALGRIGLSGTNYMGGLKISHSGSGSTVTVFRAESIWSNTVLHVGLGGLLDLNNLNIRAGALRGDGRVSMGNGSLTIGHGDTSGVFTGRVEGVAGSGRLVKIGTGTNEFNGSAVGVAWGPSTYTAPTYVSNGTLRVSRGNLNTLGTNLVTVTGSGQLDGTGKVAKVLVNAGGTIEAGTHHDTAQLTISNQLELGVGGRMIWNLSNKGGTEGAASGWDTVSVSNGTIEITATAVNTFTVRLTSVSAPGTLGPAANFSAYSGFTAVIARASSAINGFAANKFTVDATEMQNAPDSTAWSIRQTGNTLELVYAPAVAEDTNVANWPNSLGITFCGYQNEARLTNFPALIVLSKNALNGSNMYAMLSNPANGYDLRFATTDAVPTLLSFEVESWNTNGDSHVWVRIPTLDPGTKIRMLGGNTTQTNGWPARATDGSTWSEFYIGVWHMGQVDAQDSTSNRIHGVGLNGNTVQSIGKIGAGGNFDGVNDYITFGAPSQVNTNTQHTIEAWFKPPASASSKTLIGAGVSGAGRWAFRQMTTGMRFTTLGVKDHDMATTVSVGAWQHTAMTYTPATSAIIYQNGVVGGSSAASGAITPAASLIIGANGVGTEFYAGELDEVRLSMGVRSTNWLYASYYNQAQPSAFYCLDNAVTKLRRDENFTTAGVQEGDGIWDNVSNAWQTVGGANVAWVEGMTAQFGDGTSNANTRNVVLTNLVTVAGFETTNGGAYVIHATGGGRIDMPNRTTNLIHRDLTLSSRIVGSQGMVKLGTGALTIAPTNAANSFVGTILVSNGTLAIGGNFNDAAFNGALNIASGARLRFDQVNKLSNTSTVTLAAGSVFDVGPGDYIGWVSGMGVLTNMTGDLGLDVLGSDIILGGNIYGTTNHGLTLRGSTSRGGTLWLTGTNNFGFLRSQGSSDFRFASNGVTYVGGNFQLNTGGGFDGADMILEDQAVVNTLYLRMMEASGHNATLTQRGGTLIVRGSDDEEGAMRVGHYPDDTATYFLSGGSLWITNVHYSSGNRLGRPAKLGLAQDGTGVFNLSGGTATVECIGINERSDDTGHMYMSNGLLRIGRGGMTNEGAYSIHYAGGTIEAFMSSFISLTGSLTGVNGNLNLNGTTNSLTLSGVLRGAGGINKIGSGYVVLNAANGYAGDTVVSNGYLMGASNGSLGLGTVRLQGGHLALSAPGLWEEYFIGSDFTSVPDLRVRDWAVGADIAHYGPNEVIAYKGVIQNTNAFDVTYSFAENYDDEVRLSVDGVSILNNGTWNVPTVGSVTLTPGNHDIQLWVRDGGGTPGGGPVNSSWWTTEGMGVGIDRTGAGASTLANYSPIRDTGNGGFLRAPLVVNATFANNISVETAASIDASSVTNFGLFTGAFTNAAALTVFGNGAGGGPAFNGVITMVGGGGAIVVTNASAFFNGAFAGLAATITAQNGGGIGGTGNAAAVTMQAGSYLVPGQRTVGTLTASNITMAGGSAYHWTISDFNGPAGGTGGTQGWDRVVTSGAIDFSGASSGNPVTITVTSLTHNLAAGVASNLAFGNGYTCTVMEAVGGITGFATDKFVVVSASGLAPLGYGPTPIVRHDVAFNRIQLVFPADTWTGGNLVWDGNTSSAGAQDGHGNWTLTHGNWWDGSGNRTWYNPATNTAIFGAGGAGSYTVQVAGAWITNFNRIVFNAGPQYTLGGTSVIAIVPGPSVISNAGYAAINGKLRLGGVFTKQGAGVLRLGASNAVSTVEVPEGVLQLVGTGAVGNASLFVTNLGQVSLHGSAQAAGTYTNRWFIQGSGPDGSGAVVSSNSAIYGNSSMKHVVLLGDATVGGTTPTGDNGRFDIGYQNGTVTGNHFTLTKTGQNLIVMRGMATNLQVVINSGALAAEDFDTALGTNIVVNGGFADVYGARTISAPILLNGGGLSARSGGGTPVFSGTITVGAGGGYLYNTPGYGAGQQEYRLTGELTGSGTLSKFNGSSVFLTGTVANTANGTLRAHEGYLYLTKPPDVYAWQGNITISNSQLDHARLFPRNRGQFPPSTVITFQRNAAVGFWPYLILNAQTVVVAGIQCTQPQGVIESYEFTGAHGPALLIISNDANYYYDGFIRNHSGGNASDSLSLIKQGTGTQTIASQYVSYTGRTWVAQGVLVYADTYNFAADITNDARVVLAPLAAGQDFGTRRLSGPGTWVKAGASSLVLRGTNSFTGEFVISNSYLDVYGNGSLSSNAVVTIESPQGLVIYQGSTNYVSALRGQSTAALIHGNSANVTGRLVSTTSGTETYNGRVFQNAGPIMVEMIGSGTQVLAGTVDNTTAKVRVQNGTLRLAKTSSASVHAVGGTGHDVTIWGGTLQLGGTGNDQIYTQSDVTMSGGVLDLAGLNEGFDELDGTAGVVSNSSGTASMLTIGEHNNGGDFSGVFSDGVGILNVTKVGTGRQILRAAMPDYSGTVYVSNGTIRVVGALPALGHGMTYVQALGLVDGTGTLGRVTVANGGVLNSGSGAGFNECKTLTFTNLVADDGGVLRVDIQDFTGTPGVSNGTSLLEVRGPLTISSTSVDPVVIELKTLGANEQAGAAANFNALNGYTVVVANAESITGFAADRFSVDASGFQNSYIGVWQVGTLASTSLVVTFTPVTLSTPFLVWDADAGTHNSQDGSGVWKSGGDDWWTGSTNISWNNSFTQLVYFGSGGGGTYTSTADSGFLTTYGMIFRTNANYEIAGTGRLHFANAEQMIVVSSEVATLSAAITGNTGFVKAGGGTLVLGGANLLTGVYTVGKGVLAVANNGPMDIRLGRPDSVIVSNGAQFQYRATNQAASTKATLFRLSGVGPDGNGAMYNAGGFHGSYSQARWIQLQGDTTIGTRTGPVQHRHRQHRRRGRPGRRRLHAQHQGRAGRQLDRPSRSHHQPAGHHRQQRFVRRGNLVHQPGRLCLRAQRRGTAERGRAQPDGDHLSRRRPASAIGRAARPGRVRSSCWLTPPWPATTSMTATSVRCTSTAA
jgi:autotransporter-associated beta strand protein